MSSTYLAAIVGVLAFVLPYFGLDIADNGTLSDSIQEFAGIASVLYVFYGRYKAGGINAFGIRKK